ncbi:alpha/beta hydrolase [Candidatus Parcubacteria bacterium]|nr:alpha/beta hydrolase [Candidatus Parcubacteria bacterium]
MQQSQEKTILILHGWGSFSEKWRKTGDLLSKNNFQVIAPDLPGFGKSSDPPKPWDVDDYVEWVKNFIVQKKLKNFFLLGHSFGGRVAIKFSAKYPEKVEKLILVSSAGIKPKTNHLNFLAGAKKVKWLPGFSLTRKIFYKYILRKTDYFKAKGVMRETFKKIIEEDLTFHLSKIKISTLIIWGDKDKMTPISDAYLMNRKIPNSKLEILKNIGHFPYLKCPEKLSEIILKFIL